MRAAEFTERSPGHFVELVDAEQPNKRLRSGVVNVKEGGRLSVFRRLPFFDYASSAGAPF
jgi:hypothetical protein